MNRITLSALGFLLAVMAVVGCSVTEPPPFDARTILQIQQGQASDAARRQMPALPTTLESPFVPPADKPAAAPEVRDDRLPPRAVTFREAKRLMTLQEVIHRTVACNGDVRVSSFDQAIDEARITEAAARFDATVFADGKFTRSEGATSLNANPFSGQRLKTWQADTGVRQIFVNGTQVELKYTSTRNQVNPPPGFGGFPPVNPYYQNELALQVTQPLLQNAGTEVNRARIVIAQNDQRISRMDFRLKVEEIVANVEKAYWQLVLANRQVEIQQELLNRTVETAVLLAKRWGNDVSNVQLSQSNAAIQSRYLQLIRAKSQVQDLSDQIKQLMGDPDFPVSSSTLIVAADKPVETAINFAVADQVEAALTNRAELAQQLLRIDSATVVTKAAKNNLLPALNIVGSVSIDGLGSHWEEATRSNADLVNYSIGFTFEIPIGNRAARAIWARTLLQRLQAIQGYKSLVDKVMLDLKTGQREVETSWGEIAAARQARFAAADALAAIETRQNIEQWSPTFVQLKLDRQSALADAERAEITAIASYNVAISALEKAKGTLLRYNNIVLQEERSPIRY